MPWLSQASTDTTSIGCPTCECTLAVDLPRADHHPIQCLSCENELLVFSGTKTTFAVDLDAAPSELGAALRWMQQHFDELDVTGLFDVVFLAELRRYGFRGVFGCLAELLEILEEDFGRVVRGSVTEVVWHYIGNECSAHLS